MKKKFVLVILVLIILPVICTAIYSLYEKSKIVNLVVGENQESLELSIDDFVCEYDKMTDDYTNEYFSVGFTNNSKYDVLGMTLAFSSEAIDRPIEAEKNVLIKSGEKIKFRSMYPGHEYWAETIEDLEARIKKYANMEPSILKLRIVTDDLDSYLVSYDFTSKEWSNLNKATKLNVMPDSELAKKIVEPDCQYYWCTEDSDEDKEIYKKLGYEEHIAIQCYDISLEEFNEYLSKIKEAGFIDNAVLNDYDYRIDYDAKNAEENELYLRYFEDDKYLIIGILKKLMEE